MEGQKQQPNCLKCLHFKITWDPVCPRACEVFGFKGQAMPSQEVFRATGLPCPAFARKEGLR